jgi:hypothetical protein
MKRWQRVDAGSQRGVFGLALSSPHMYIVTKATFRFREESRPGDAAPKIIIEGGEWECSLSDIYYQDPDGNRHRAGDDAQNHGELSPTSSTASVEHYTEKETGRPMVRVSIGLRADDPRVPYRLIPLKIVSDREQRMKTVLGSERERKSHSVQLTGAFVTGPFENGAALLRSQQRWSAGEETWVIRGWEDIQPPELILEPDHYDDWWPAGGDDERTPGNAIVVTAKLQRRGGGPYRYPARRIRFELVRVSREPGVSLNWPPRDQLASPTPCDLQIDPKRNRSLLVTDDVHRQKARTPDGEYFEAAVAISAYDWGAFGRLRAVAELTNGGSVVGHLKGEPRRTEVLLPKRQDDSRIADSWKKRTDSEFLNDDSDDEDDPVGNGFPGDGLSLYEEYRGFHEHGAHIEGDAKKKDLFLRDEIGTPFSRQGVALFQTVSGLNVHHRLRDSELEPGRVINVNRQSAHLVDQHALVLKRENPGFYGGEATGGPGVPREIEALRIHPGLVHFFRRYSDATILAHEMLHGANVWHHGERDIGMVEWRLGDYAGQPCVYEIQTDENGATISRRVTVYRNVGSSRVPVPPQIFRAGMKLWVAARQGGQHSGQKKCLMTYDIASAVAGPQVGGFYERTLVDSPSDATYLCDSPQGTSHFGNADSTAGFGPRQRGNCVKQICVNDKFTGP